MNKVEKVLVKILYCYASNTVFEEEMLEGASIKEVFSLALSHSLDPVLSFVLKGSSFLSEAERNALDKATTSNIRRLILMNSERESLFAEFEGKGISYMPLKGIMLQYDYPDFGARKMADNDIFYLKKDMKKVKEIFVKRGYEVESLGIGHHDGYQKKPIYNFEMHRQLFDVSYEKYYQYFEGITSKWIKDDDNGYGYHMSKEDEYLFLIAHAHKHYSHSGNGLRYPLDIFFFLRKYKDSLNLIYINKELEKLGLRDFEEKSVRLANKLFSSLDGLSEEEEVMFEEIITSGTYGTVKKHVSNALKESPNKFVYLLKRLFPPYSYFKAYHPFLAKTIIFIPFYDLYRLLKALFTKGKTVLNEIKAVNEYK